MLSHTVFLHPQHPEANLADSFFPSYPWWPMPFQLPEVSCQNPLFKDFIGHPWETAPDRSIWKWSSLWNGTVLCSFLFWDADQTLPALYWFYLFLQFSCWTVSSLRSEGNVLIISLASISQNIDFMLLMSVTHIGHSLKYFMIKMWLKIRQFYFDARFWGLK